MTLSSPSAIRTRAPVASGMRPPLSIMRPDLISRSVIFCIASINAGDGAAIGLGEVTMYMKRMQKLLLRREAAVSAAKSARYWDDDPAGAGSTSATEKLRGRANATGAA